MAAFFGCADLTGASGRGPGAPRAIQSPDGEHPGRTKEQEFHCDVCENATSTKNSGWPGLGGVCRPDLARRRLPGLGGILTQWQRSLLITNHPVRRRPSEDRASVGRPSFVLGSSAAGMYVCMYVAENEGTFRSREGGLTLVKDIRDDNSDGTPFRVSEPVNVGFYALCAFVSQTPLQEPIWGRI